MLTECCYLSSSGGERFWVSPASTLSEGWQPRSLDIEVAAYALLSHFLQRQAPQGLPVMRWLSRKRTSLGGFVSTQVRDAVDFPTYTIDS